MFIIFFFIYFSFFFLNKIKRIIARILTPNTYANSICFVAIPANNSAKNYWIQIAPSKWPMLTLVNKCIFNFASCSTNTNNTKQQSKWDNSHELTGKASWMPIENTYYHFLILDLGSARTITKIATLGRSHTHEFVTEYIVQYSDDGELWRSYVSPGGEVQVNTPSPTSKIESVQ